MAMNKTLKRKWLKALRSGRFQQGQHSLFQRVPRTREKRYCCLGVLCVVAGATNRSDGYHYKGKVAESFLSSTLTKVAKLSEEEQWKLVRMNDSQGASFEDIALYVEEAF